MDSCCLQVELVGMSYVGLKAVVDFMYSGELSLDGGNLDFVLKAAHLLQVRNRLQVKEWQSAEAERTSSL